MVNTLHRKRIQQLLPASTAFLMIALGSNQLQASGLFRNGIGARSSSLTGADVAVANDPLGAMYSNPAGLAYLTSQQLQLGATVGYVHGTFSNAANSNATLDKWGGIPEMGFGLPLGDSPVSLGLSFMPEAALSANWTYVDAPGGLGGVSYGTQTHRSDITVLRTALGAAVKLGDKWSLGASVGLVYNDNKLKAPYVFQNTPLAGAKTLLDLNTDGFGVNAQFGAIYRPNEHWQFGVSYRTETSVRSRGDANGDVGAQLALPSVPFHYDAQVNNHFPQMATAGAAWQFHPRWRLSAQLDWINWSDSFDRLPVKLYNGSNAAVNAAMGGPEIEDEVPLNWKDQFVYRTGIEFTASKAWKIRAGYSYGSSPVPDATLTPLTAAITEHTIGIGAGWEHGRYTLDFGYQVELPAEQKVGTSALRSGEYNNSRTGVQIHWFSVTTGMKF